MEDEEGGEDLQLAPLLCWLKWPMRSQRKPVRVEDLDKPMHWGKEDLCDPPRSGAEGRLLEVVYPTAGTK